MANDTEITPADELRRIANVYDGYPESDAYLVGEADHDLLMTLADRIGAFTWADVDALRELIEGHSVVHGHEVAALTRIADRIAALLPSR